MKRPQGSGAEAFASAHIWGADVFGKNRPGTQRPGRTWCSEKQMLVSFPESGAAAAGGEAEKGARKGGAAERAPWSESEHAFDAAEKQLFTERAAPYSSMWRFIADEMARFAQGVNALLRGGGKGFKNSRQSRDHPYFPPPPEGSPNEKLALGDQMSVNLNLAVAKYAYGEGWERPHLRSSRFNAIRKGH